MKTVLQHIEHVKGKPHHVRKRVAFGAATFGTAIIALVWLASSLGTGSFALKQTSFADNAGEGALTVSSDNGTDPVRGVAGAAAGLDGASAPARIQIIDAAPATTSMKKAEQTTIPF